MPGTLEQPALFIEGLSPITGINTFCFTVSAKGKLASRNKAGGFWSPRYFCLRK